MANLTFKEKKLYLDGQPFDLASGDMHYFRFLPGGWRRRLRLMKAFGLTAVQTYVPWNLHERQPGDFDFSGRLDLGTFLRMCQEEGLYVMLRPSPYICSECDWGGLPSWLVGRASCPRTMDEEYIVPFKRYFERLCQEFVPYLSSRGGPIIAVALENEYGSFATDLPYIRYCERLYRENGIDVPLYTAGGPGLLWQKYGGFPEIWSGIDVGGDVPGAMKQWEQFQQGFPPYVAELWGGCAQQWGSRFPRKSPETVAKTYEEALAAGAYVNFYMFCGGTNYGFFSGGLKSVFRADPPGAERRYVPFATSYDVDAPVDEMGRPTRKYFLCREVLAKHRGIAVDKLPPVPENPPVQAPEAIRWQSMRRLMDGPVLEAMTEKKIRSGSVRPMEALGQDYGWILYSAALLRTDPRYRYRLILENVHDRADIFWQGRYLGAYYRDRPYTPVEWEIEGDEGRLDILVENMGRIGFGSDMLNEWKGLSSPVRVVPVIPGQGEVGYPGLVTGWEIRSLPMGKKQLAAAWEAEGKDMDGPGPRLYKGSFKARPGMDTCLNFKGSPSSPTGLQKGFVCINGMNMGRYWAIGPQDTLYIPGEILKEENTIEIFDLYGGDEWPRPFFCREMALDSLSENAECMMAPEKKEYRA